MKKIILLSIFTIFSMSFAMAQLPLNKTVKILSSVDKSRCLSEESWMLNSLPYKEKFGQEWQIVPTDEAGLYYLKIKKSLYLTLNRNDASSDTLYLAFNPDSNTIDNRHKFRIQSINNNEWEISPKLRPDLYLQQFNGENAGVCFMPKLETSVTAFVIDTVPYRRPIPKFTNFENTECAAGVLRNLEQQEIAGCDATFFQTANAVYKAQLIVRVYLSSDKKDRIEMVFYEDLRKIKKKEYQVQPKGPKTQPFIRLFVDDKPEVIDQASVKLEIVGQHVNSFTLLVQQAKNSSTPVSKSLEVFDIAVKGHYIIQ